MSSVIKNILEPLKAKGGVFAKIAENMEKELGCNFHTFVPFNGQKVENGVILSGANHSCTRCGAYFSHSEVVFYLRGYAAAGGNTDRAYPGWNDGHDDGPPGEDGGGREHNPRTAH